MSKFRLRTVLDTLEEDAPTNSAGAGNIDGLGVGPKGEPGVYRKQLKLYRRKNTGGQKGRSKP
jgi:hypothetical protein